MRETSHFWKLWPIFSEFCGKDLLFSPARYARRPICFVACSPQGMREHRDFDQKTKLIFCISCIFGGRYVRYDRYDCYSRPISTVWGWSQAGVRRTELDLE